MRAAWIALLVLGCSYGHAIVRRHGGIEENRGQIRYEWSLISSAPAPPRDTPARLFDEEQLPPDAEHVGDLTARMSATGWGDEGIRRDESEFYEMLGRLAAELGGTHYRVVDAHGRMGIIESLDATVYRLAPEEPTDATVLYAPTAHVHVVEATPDAHIVTLTSGDEVRECVAPCTLSVPPGPTSVRVAVGEHVFTRALQIPTGRSLLTVRHDDGQIAAGIGWLAGWAALETLGFLWIGGVFSHDYVLNTIGAVPAAGAVVLFVLGLAALITHVDDDARLGTEPPAVSLRVGPSGPALVF